MIALTSPTVARLIGYENKRDTLAPILKYRDEKVEYEYRRLAKNSWLPQQIGQDAYDQQLRDLAAQRVKSILFEDDDGFWTYSGVASLLADKFQDRVESFFETSPTRSIPWAKVPEKIARAYQTEATEKLLAVRHGGVEIGTGLGKSFIIRSLLKEIGQPALVMAPSLSIAGQLYRDFVTHFGKAKVGRFFGSHKEPKKHFVVGVSASLARCEEGSEFWAELTKKRVFVADESHMCPATTLANVCFGLAKTAEYRFFFSGTQLRNDGLDLLLDAITGPIVFRMSVREGVDQGFLSRPNFRMLWIESDVKCTHPDAMVLTRKHVYGNPQVAQLAADCANRAVAMMGRPTLILIDEMEQFGHLYPLLKHPVRFAHGGVTDKNRALVPEQFWGSDTEKLVDDFNALKFPILVGTSCVSVGTDLCAPGCIVYLRGGKSEIEVRQSAVGRGTRLFPGKTDCVIFDVGISNVPTLERHAKARAKIYREIYPSYEETRVRVRA